MKVLLVHNEYGRFSGEEAVLHDIHTVLTRHGHDVLLFQRSSAEIARMHLGRVRAFFSGVFSFSSRREVADLLGREKPDIAHVQNLFPLLSPSVLIACREARIPVVMGLHNYRLVCPHGIHWSGGRLCEQCRGGREYWCVLRNCEQSLPKSLGYALRNYVARKARFFADNVTLYYTLTEFQRQRMVESGLPRDRIDVIPNMVQPVDVPQDLPLGDYVALAGRVTPEKGIDTVMRAAVILKDVPFQVAGSYHSMPNLPSTTGPNFLFRGHLGPVELDSFYRHARMLVLASVCYETFGFAQVEGMMRAKPVLCSGIGGLPEIVDDGVTGLVFKPGDATELAEKVRYLWDRPDLCRQMGMAGRAKALRVYSPESVYERLMAAYEKAIALGSGGAKMT